MVTVRIKEKHGAMLLQSIVKELTTVYTRAGHKKLRVVKRLFNGKILISKYFPIEESQRAEAYMESI